jgi:hypothetical protein
MAIAWGASFCGAGTDSSKISPLGFNAKIGAIT